MIGLRRKMLAAIAGLGLACALAGLSPTTARAQSGEAGQGSAQGAAATASPQATPAVLTAEQLALREQWESMGRLGPRVPDGETLRASPALPATPGPSASKPPSAAPPAPGDFVVYFSHDQAPFSGGSKSDINEPSVGTANKVVFVSSNWDAGFSTDGGNTFSFQDPYTTFPSMDGGFCCDQSVHYDPTTDLVAWSLQYVKSGSTSNDTGGWRVAFTKSGSVASGNWCYWTFHPNSFGLANTGLWLDYPDVSISNGYIWFSVNVFTTVPNQQTGKDVWQDTLIWRISLAQVASVLNTCGFINWNYFVVNDHFTFSLVQGATTTMYWLSQTNTSNVRIYHWDESSNTIFWDDRSVTTWSDAARVCTAPDNSNPCGRADGSHGMTGWVAGGVLGWMWSSAPVGSHPNNFIRVARFDQNTRNLINEPDIYNDGTNSHFIYNAVGVNGRGHIAGVVYFVGAGFYQYAGLIIWDDITAAPPPPWEIHYQVQSGAGTNSAWGDYYTTRRHSPFSNTWVSVFEQKLASGTVHTWYQWYGRQRDAPVTAAVNTHDFNGDGFSDIAWRDSSANFALWLMSGTSIVGSVGFGSIPNWSIVGQRDFDGNGKYDWLWRDTSGNLAIWFLNGTQIASSASLGTISTIWTVVGTADFNGDGKGDILWRDSSGNLAMWLMSGGQVIGSVGFGQIALSWTVAGTADLNGDGNSDIVWLDSSGNVAVWLMNGTTIAASAGITNVGTAWRIVGTGDFDGNGKWDILWRDNSGNVAIWFMNGTQVAAGVGLGGVSNVWVIQDTGDYNKDGRSDILWRDNTGNLAYWYMNGSQVTNAGIGNVPTSWTVQTQNVD